MSVIKVNVIQFNAVSVSKAVRDIRYYLNHVYLSPNGDLVCTDGHRMCVAQNAFDKHEGFEGLIVDFTAKLPKGSEYLEFDTETLLVTVTSKIGEPLMKSSFSIIDGRFPDYQRVFRSYDKAANSMFIGVNSDYLADAKKVFKSCKQPGVKITINASESLMFTHTELPNVSYLVLACRL